MLIAVLRSRKAKIFISSEPACAAVNSTWISVHKTDTGILNRLTSP